MRTKTFLAAALLAMLAVQFVTAKTVKEERWQQTKYCTEGDEKDWIILTREYTDGSTATKYMWRDCDETCWEETPWSDGSGLVAGVPSYPASVDGSGNWTLQSVPVGSGGTFTTGSGETCRGFVPDPVSTVILIPFAVIGNPDVLH